MQDPPSKRSQRKDTQPSRLEVCAPEILSQAQSTRIAEYLSASQAQGAMVGAAVGGPEWNIKPLIFERGLLFMLRFSDPALALKQQQHALLGEMTEKLISTGSVLAGGRSGLQYWQRRLFYQSALAEAQEISESGLGVHPVVLAQKLISLVQMWGPQGIVHGHLCASNLAIENQQPVPMDFGFCAFSLELCQTAEDLAPELQQGHPPSHQTDLFGLGLLLKLLLKDLLNPVQTGLLADLVGDLPDARPSAETVRRELFPGLGKKAMRAFPRTLPHIGGVKLGKLLGKNLHVKENETAEEPSEAVKEPENHLHSRSAEETLQWLKGTVALGQEVTQCIREQLNEPDSVASCPPEKIDPCSTPDPHSNESSSTRQRQVTEENLKLHLPEEQKSTDRLSWWFWILLALILVLTVLYKRGLLSSEPEVTLQAPLPYEEFWQSGLTSKMREVVLAAVSGQDPQAELFIVKQALSGKESPHIQHDLIKIAFDPRWEGDLKPVDRQLALKLAMAGLLGRQIGQVPGLNDIHPGVLLAIIANLSLDSSNAEINAISTSQLKVLPPPYGPFFEFLDEIGLKNFASPSARAAAQIIVGRATPQVLSVYFSDEDDAVLSAKKLRLLLAISSHNPTMIENIYRALLSSRNVLRDLLKWFENTKLSHWKDVPVEDRLKLAAGELPGKALKLESYADLLRFPVMAVREAAADTLRRDFFSENMHSTISLLASPRNKLTRYQTIFLVTALGADRDTRYSLLAAWFGTKPNPQSVLDLIILRRNIQVVDPLTIDGVRYLRGLNFSLSRPELLKLLYHFEPLARAWAYSKLEVSNAEDLKLLREALTRETLPVLKQQIRLKLEDLWDETARK